MPDQFYMAAEYLHIGIILAIIGGLIALLLNIRKNMDNWMDMFRK